MTDRPHPPSSEQPDETSERALSLKETVRLFPSRPGVYVMKDAEGEVLYVGKAKELQKRVLSYFSAQNSGKVTLLMKKAERIEYIITQDEHEALLLEHNLIKSHRPRYNVLLKDDKTFPVIRVTAEEYPRVFKTRSVVRDGSTYYGPYSDAGLLHIYLQFIEKQYPLRRCRHVKPRKHPCLYYHLGRCAAVCAGKTSKEDYAARIAQVHALLQGKTERLKKECSEGMRRASDALAFEEAQKYRDLLLSLKEIERTQRVIGQGVGGRFEDARNSLWQEQPHKPEQKKSAQPKMDLQMDLQKDPQRVDYIAYRAEGSDGYATLVRVADGRVSDSVNSHVHVFDDEKAPLGQFLIALYENSGDLPSEVIVSTRAGEDVEAFLRSRYGIAPRPPQSAPEMRIMKFALQNAEQALRRRAREQGNAGAVRALKDALGLPKLPLLIEGLDIATMKGKHTVAALVSFANGAPDTAEYRHFSIKTIPSGQMDDYGALQEAAARRYTRRINEKKPLPDLLLVDGGQGQVNSVQEIISALGADIAVVGLAKRNEEIFFPSHGGAAGKNSGTSARLPLQLPKNHPASRLLQAVRDEAHRFGTSFRAARQDEEITRLSYENIAGIGAARARKIAELFASPKDVAEADAHIVAKSVGIPEPLARAVQEAARRIADGEAAEDTAENSAENSAGKF